MGEEHAPPSFKASGPKVAGTGFLGETFESTYAGPRRKEGEKEV